MKALYFHKIPPKINKGFFCNCAYYIIPKEKCPFSIRFLIKRGEKNKNSVQVRLKYRLSWERPAENQQKPGNNRFPVYQSRKGEHPLKSTA
jgi:hypothetical protein